MSQYNPMTLTPIGAENEEEEETEDGEKGADGGNSTRRQSTMQPPGSTKGHGSQGADQGGLSRQVTGISTATTEALPDDD